MLDSQLKSTKTKQEVKKTESDGKAKDGQEQKKIIIHKKDESPEQQKKVNVMDRITKKGENKNRREDLQILEEGFKDNGIKRIKLREDEKEEEKN